MALDPKEKHNTIKDKVQKERRSFLKKTLYAAPTLIVLGQLARPSTANADCEDGIGSCLSPSLW